MKRNDWTVGEYSIRPAGPKDRCFYCGAKVGEQHKKDCVIRDRTIKIRAQIDLVAKVPESWDEEKIDFYFNESSWCTGNIIPMLEERNEKKCLCDCTRFFYLGEANAKDEKEWGMAFVVESES